MKRDINEAQTCVKEIKNELIEAYKKGNLYEYLSDNVLSVIRDEDNDIEKIAFTIGGPFVYLDFAMRSGQIIYTTMDEPIVAKTAISWSVWSDIKDEIINIYDVVK